MNDGTMWALLPLKEFASAKQRLTGLLGPEQRIGLLDAMANDVLQALSGHPELDGMLVVSNDPLARELALRYGADFISESELDAQGLNPVVQAGVARLAQRGIAEALIIHGDLPLVTPAEISQLIQHHRHTAQPALTLATDRHGTGSNGLMCPTGSALTFGYGAASCRWHQHQAQTLGMACNVLSLPGMSCDIDAPDDLLAFLNHPNAAAAIRTRAYLSASGIARQLLVQEDP